MARYELLKKEIFRLEAPGKAEELALDVFRWQARNNPVYRRFLEGLHVNPENIISLEAIPFLPIELFRNHKVLTGNDPVQEIFTSSGTTGSVQSRHYVTDVSLYEQSFREAFSLFYGDINDYVLLALLPSYLERKGSSLVYMVNDLIQRSAPGSGFYLHNKEELIRQLETLDKSNKKVLLLGVTYALLDLAEEYPMQLKNTIIMETGGMKGRRKELIREEVHTILCKAFDMENIHSEYGMTELLSQAYSNGNGIFRCPPWMKVLIRDTDDPLSVIGTGKTGGINVIDLANISSCSFIATQDLGKLHEDGSFEVLGRFDNSDIRGCNLMVM